jgi:2-oxo-4-hydroxy-4-carboxy-5-ureidoimidazoline decarboxylase
MTLTELNELNEQSAYAQFETCCVTPAWVHAMVASRPFESLEQLLNAADQHWRQASEADILLAFDGHPRIGDVSTLKAKFANTASTAGHEQSGMNTADDDVLHAMKQRNDEYFEKFGYIFIVCASGKTASEMLALLEARLPNTAADELNIAANEQAKITQLRLRKLLDESL